MTLHCAANAKGYVSEARNQNGGIVHFGYLNGVDKGAFLVVIAHSANKATKVLHACGVDFKEVVKNAFNSGFRNEYLIDFIIRLHNIKELNAAKNLLKEMRSYLNICQEDTKKKITEERIEKVIKEASQFESCLCTHLSTMAIFFTALI